MTYESDEIVSSVSKVVQGRSTYTRDGLGARNVKDRFNDVRELVDSTLLYEPDSVFYLIYKAAIRTRYLLNSALGTMDEVEQDLNDMAIPSKAVKDTTAISDAKGALSVISGALGRRGSISNAEYARYDRATAKALSVYGESAKRTYTPFGETQAVTDVVRSSSEARDALRSSYAAFTTSYKVLLDAVDTLLGSFEDYNHDEVVRKVASRQISRLHTELETLETAFNKASPVGRSKTARQDTLTLLTNRATVKALSRVRRPEDPKLEQASTGATKYQMGANGTGTAPNITGTKSGPWPIKSGDTLSVKFNAIDPTVSVPLITGGSGVPGISAATLTGSNAEAVGVRFAINESLTAPWPLLTMPTFVGLPYAITNQFLYLIVDGVMYKISDSLPNGWSGALPAIAVAAAINAVVGPPVTATVLTVGPVECVRIQYNILPSSPDTLANRYIQGASGPYNAAALAPFFVEVDPLLPFNYPGALTTGWDGNDELWIWPNDLTEATAVKVDLPNGTWPDYVVTASAVEAAIDAATAELEASVSSGKIVLTSNDEGEGSILRIISDGLIGGAKSPSLSGAETLGFYDGQENRQANVDSLAIVNVLNSNASFSAKAVAEVIKEELFASNKTAASGANTFEVTAEDDPSDGWTTAEMKVQIKSGENEGTYGITLVNYVAPTLTVTLDRNLRDPSAQTFKVSFYKELLKITAKDDSTVSYIQVTANTAQAKLGLSTTITRGTVEQILVNWNDPVKGWVFADLRGLGIKIGDLILEEDGTYIATVTDLSSLSTGVLGVTPISPTFSSSAFVIKSAALDSHEQFLPILQSWKDAIPKDQLDLSALTKLIGQVLNIANPDYGRVQAASSELQQIRLLLEGSTALSGILEGFTIDPIPAVDRALDVLTESGQDRARDLLTKGEFSEYNNTNYKTASTGGAVMAAASDVAASDLVEPTKTRSEFTSEIDRYITTIDSEIDPKYDFEDMRSDRPPAYLDYFAADIPGGSK